MGKEAQRAEAFVHELASVYGDDLVSAVLYGSAARDQFQEGMSDLNILALLRTIDPATVRRGSAAARAWVAEGNPPPLILAEDELRRSLDVFAIEYSDIGDAHRVLHGTDPFAHLDIDAEHLRLQCEHELKGKQIQLRERYLLAAENPDELGELLVRSISTFLVLFRTVLRLAGEPVPRETGDVVAAVARRAGFAPEPMRNVLRMRRSGTVLRPAPSDGIVIGYLESVARTVEFVDGMGTAKRR